MERCQLDHIVIGAATLVEGVAFIRDRLGVDIPPGGKHQLMGTHNHLMRLGESAFLEVISIDPAAPAPGRPRWFDLDNAKMRARLAAGPKLITWVVRSADIEATAQASAVPLGPIMPVSRDALSWRLTIPDDGRIPGDGLVPHVIQWDGNARPWERMAAFGWRLEALVLSHSNPEAVKAGLSSLGADSIAGVRVEEADAPGLTARIRTASGEIVDL